MQNLNFVENPSSSILALKMIYKKLNILLAQQTYKKINNKEF